MKSEDQKSDSLPTSSSSAARSTSLGIHVELFGIARQRAGVGEVLVIFEREPITLADVVAQLATKFPKLEETCFEKGKIKRDYVVSLNGDQFVREGNTVLHLGDRLLLLSADAGG